MKFLLCYCLHLLKRICGIVKCGDITHHFDVRVHWGVRRCGAIVSSLRLSVITLMV